MYEHPFWVVGQGWVSASHLKSGDIFKLESGKTIAVEKIEFELLNEPVKVYNFEVEDFHTYYVGESSILVHNTCYVGDARTVVSIAKEYDRIGSISRSNAEVLWGWAQQYNIQDSHGIANDSYKYGTHIKINGYHINVY